MWYLAGGSPGRWSAVRWFSLVGGRRQGPEQRTVSLGQSRHPTSSCGLLWSRTPPPPADDSSHAPVTPSDITSCRWCLITIKPTGALPRPPRTPGPPDCRLRSHRHRRQAPAGPPHRPARPIACWRDSCPGSLRDVEREMQEEAKLDFQFFRLVHTAGGRFVNNRKKKQKLTKRTEETSPSGGTLTSC